VPWVWYNISDIATAWDLLLTAGNELQKSLNYRHDLVDVTRQALQIVFDHLYTELIRSFNKKNLVSFQKNSEVLLSLLSDLNTILSSDRRFMLGPWIEEAILNGHTVIEKKTLELNARYQITLWGPKGEVLDYACKQWSGLVEDYYRPRWQLFVKFLYKSLVQGVAFKQRIFDASVFSLVEIPFIKSGKKYPQNPVNVTYIAAKYCYDKWRSYLNL